MWIDKITQRANNGNKYPDIKKLVATSVNEITSHKLKNILTQLILPLITIIILVAVHIVAGISFIDPLKIIFTVYSISFIIITIIQSVHLKSDYRHVDDTTKITSNHMMGLAIIASIVSRALICSNVYIPTSLGIANLIIHILSGIYVLLTSTYFIYCYKKIDRNAEYKFGPIEFDYENYMYFGRRDKNNQPIGNGIVLNNSGSQYIYNANWTNGRMNGKGICANENGDKYVGDWSDNKRHGIGTSTDAQGDTYEGQWEDDVFISGTVRIQYNNGDKYVGDWSDNKRHGIGKFTDAQGDTYEGKWENDVFISGKVRIQYKNSIYEGGWKGSEMTGKKDGKGTVTYSDGSIYHGQWNDGRRNGEGIFIKDKKIYRVEYRDGIQQRLNCQPRSKSAPLKIVNPDLKVHHLKYQPRRKSAPLSRLV